MGVDLSVICWLGIVFQVLGNEQFQAAVAGKQELADRNTMLCCCNKLEKCTLRLCSCGSEQVDCAPQGPRKACCNNQNTDEGMRGEISAVLEACENHMESLKPEDLEDYLCGR